MNKKYICFLYQLSIAHVDGVCDKVAYPHFNPVHGNCALTTKSYIKQPRNFISKFLSYSTKVTQQHRFFKFLYNAFEHSTCFVKIKDL